MAAPGTTPVHDTNTAQLKAWDGDEGAYWAAHADRFDRSVAPYHERLLAAAAIGASERVLDIGCGTGQTTRDAARAADAGDALGVDLSSGMLAVARQRAQAAGLANATFEQSDAQLHPFEREAYDLAVSRTGAMFFGDPTAAFANIASALRPAGRLVLVTWQPMARNEWINELAGALLGVPDLPSPPPDAPGPFSLSDPDRVRAILTTAGFADVGLEATTAGMRFGDDPDDAAQFVRGMLGWMLEGRDDTARAVALDALRASTAAHATSEGVFYGSAAWIVRAVRQL